jgi:hypothetical protein
VFDDENFDHEPIRRRRTTAAEILNMSICEPALGSGAFAIEAVRQLAAEYLTRRQDELDQRIDPEQYAEELQRVKAYIALHNVYGVDLNSTAVELAEVSLWLDTMAPGLKAPWFGLRLRAGNSLIGARHAVYSAHTLKDAKLKAVIETAPENLPVTTVHDPSTPTGSAPASTGKIFHFLLPGEGWLAAASDAEIKKLAPDEAKELRDHAKGWAGKLTKPQIAQLEKLSQRVEELWGLALRRIRAAEEQSRRAIPVWGAETSEGGKVTRAADRGDPGGCELRLPAPAPGDECMVRAVVLARPPGRRDRSADVPPVARDGAEDPRHLFRGREAQRRGARARGRTSSPSAAQGVGRSSTWSR